MEAERPKSSRKRQRSARRLEGPEEAETREDGGVARPPEKKESGSGRETSLKDSGGSVQVGQQSSIQGQRFTLTLSNSRCTLPSLAS